jgi:hypothetical protein
LRYTSINDILSLIVYKLNIHAILSFVNRYLAIFNRLIEIFFCCYVFSSLRYTRFSSVPACDPDSSSDSRSRSRPNLEPPAGDLGRPRFWRDDALKHRKNKKGNKISSKRLDKSPKRDIITSNKQIGGEAK